MAKSARSGSATSGGLMGAGSGLSGSGGGGGGIVDPIDAKVPMDVWEKIDALWRVPGYCKEKPLNRSSH